MNDDLLDEPLLSKTEVESFLADVRAKKRGALRDDITNTEFWRRAQAEMARRQAVAQIAAARSLQHATWFLAAFTALLVVVTFAPIAIKLWR